MLYAFKARFQKLAQKFAGSKMTANQATAWGLVFVAATCFCFWKGSQNASVLFLAPVFIFLRFIMNALDGMLARAQGTASPAGEVMNELFDVLGDTFSYGVLIFIFPRFQLALFCFLLAIWFCEFAGVMGKNLPGGERRQESLGGGKPERAIWMVIFSLLWALKPEWLTEYFTAYFTFLTVLTILSGLLRIQKSLLKAQGAAYTSTTKYGR